MLSNVKSIVKLFPRCPICKSKKGYDPSTFYPNVRCKSCEAEWIVHENGLELKRTSKLQWDSELLDKKYPLDFWKNLRAPQFQVKERIFAPVDYVGGHSSYRNPAIGYILLKPDSIMYKSSEGSLHKMNLKIAVEKLKALEICATQEINLALGPKSILVNSNKEYMVLSYKNHGNKLQHMIFDFHGLKKNVDELRILVSRLKKEQRKKK